MGAAATKFEPSFYVLGGTLRHDAPSYIERQADQLLYDALMRGEFCYVLTARQMGKSSLMIRTAMRLREAGVGVAVLDLTETGQPTLAEQWYGGLLAQLGQRLELEDELLNYWQAQPPLLNPLQRWLAAIRAVVLPRYPGRLVIFIDEIDLVRSLKFATDEFFAGIRECYNLRSEDPQMERLAFCLLGVATPSDLIQDSHITPFNIGRRIELHDFTEWEAAPLARGLGRSKELGAKILNRVLHWTGGHPYLTQKLCQAIADDQSVNTEQDVDKLNSKLFFSSRAHERDDNLSFVRARILRYEQDLTSLLEFYSRIRKGKRTPDDEANPLVGELRLSGITRAEDGLLKVRNRIYSRVFNQEWVASNLPEAEVRRQRKAYWRGVIRTAALGSLILGVVGWLAYTASTQLKLAQQQAKENRRLLYYSQMRVAQEEWENANAARAEALLHSNIPTSGQEDLRGFEWYYLWRLTHQDIWRVEEDNHVVALAFSPQDQTLLIGESNRASNSGRGNYYLKRYNWRNKHWLESFTIPSGPNFDLIVFSPDGRHAVTNSEPGKVVLWDVQSGKRINSFGQYDDPLAFMTFSTDGRRLATGNIRGEVKIWDVVNYRELLTVKKLSERVSWLSFSPDGRWLVASDGMPSIFLFNVADGKGSSLNANDQIGITAAAFFSEGKRLLTVNKDGKARIQDFRSGKILKEFNGHDGYTQAIAFSPDGARFATGSYDRTVKIWSADAGQEITTIRGHGAAVMALAWTADGKQLVTGSGDNCIKVWDVMSQPEIHSPAESVESYLTTTFSRTGELLAVGYTKARQKMVWNLSTGREISRLEGDHSADKLLCATFSADGTKLATGGMDHLVKVWDITTGRLMTTLKGHRDYVYGVDFSPDGTMLVSGGKDQTIRLWDLKTGALIRMLKSDVENAWRAVFSPDGRMVASACNDGSVKLWDVSSGNVLKTFKGHNERVKAIAFSSDGKFLGTGGADNSVKIWNIIRNSTVISLGQSDSVQRLAFSPDGKRLVTGSVNGAVKLLDLLNRQELMTMDGHKEEVRSVTFSADGSRLVTSSADGTVRFWRAAKITDTPATRSN